MSLADIDRYDHRRVERLGARAVVLGASIAGLLAARVLADAFDLVTVIDRDPLHEDLAARRGVPQGQHPHVLMRAGQHVMEDLAPGFAQDLVASGALVLDLNRELQVHAADGFIAPGTIDMPMHFASRPLIERLLRDRIAAHDRVTLWPDCQVADHLPTDEGGGIQGVVALHDGDRHEVPAEVVVDATGRTSRTRTWFERLGYAMPESESVRVDLAYRTCQVERPPHDRRAMLIMPHAPRTRGAAVTPIEDDRWLITLFGLHGDHAPGDLDGMRDFAATLPASMVREILDDHELVTPDIAHYRFPTSARHRYDRLDDHPPGLVTVGDAIASFNPIYGQGMSVAALEALALHHALTDEGVEHLASSFYGRIGRIVEGAWNLSAGGDFQFPQTQGPKPRATDMVNRYITRLHRRAHTDHRLAEQFRRVVVMEEPATSLFRPQMAWRVLRPGALTSRSSSAAA